MNFLGFGNSASFVFKFTSSIKGRPLKTLKHRDGGVSELVIFQGDEPIRGEVTVIPKSKKLEHIGIKIELVGQTEMFDDKVNATEFTSLVRELDAPGLLYNEKSYPFDFSNIQKPYESYSGLNVKLRYFLRVTVSKQYGSSSSKEQDFWVQHLQPEPEINNSIKMEVGYVLCFIDSLHTNLFIELKNVCILNLSTRRPSIIHSKPLLEKSISCSSESRLSTWNLELLNVKSREPVLI